MLCPLCLGELSSEGFCKICHLTFNVEIEKDVYFPENMKDWKITNFIVKTEEGLYVSAEKNEKTKFLMYISDKSSEIPEGEPFESPVETFEYENKHIFVWDFPENNLLSFKDTSSKNVLKLVDLFIEVKKYNLDFEPFPFEIIFKNKKFRIISSRLHAKTSKTPYSGVISSPERILSGSFSSQSSVYVIASLIYVFITKKYPMGLNYPVSFNIDNISPKDRVVFSGLKYYPEERLDLSEMIVLLQKSFSAPNPVFRLAKYAWTAAGLLSLSVLGYGMVYLFLKIN